MNEDFLVLDVTTTIILFLLLMIVMPFCIFMAGRQDGWFSMQKKFVQEAIDVGVAERRIDKQGVVTFHWLTENTTEEE